MLTYHADVNKFVFRIDTPIALERALVMDLF